MAVATGLQLTRRRARGATRVIAAAVGILVLLLAPLASRRHAAEQAHGVCEHGDPVHVERIGDAPVPPPSGAPTLSDPTWWQAHGDHHCAATATVVATRPEVPVTTAAATTTASPAPILTSRVTTAAGLYQLAPKTSPPV